MLAILQGRPRLGDTHRAAVGAHQEPFGLELREIATDGHP